MDAELTVIVPFGDDEEVVAPAARALAQHLRATGISFELLFVDEESGDNSHAVLSLLRGDIPELEVLAACGRGKGYGVGVMRATGGVVWMLSIDGAVRSLSEFWPAYTRIVAGSLDVFVVDGRFTVAPRPVAHSVLGGVRGGARVHGLCARRALAGGWRVEHRHSGGASRRSESLFSMGRPWERLATSGPIRAALTWIDGGE